MVLRNTTEGKVDKSRTCEITWWNDSTPWERMYDWLHGGLHGIAAYWTGVHDDGKEHAHLVIWSNNIKTFDEWRTFLTRTKCPAVKSVNPLATDRITLSNSVEGSVRYLLHLDSPDKSQGHTIDNTIWQDLTYDPEDKLHAWCEAPTLNAVARSLKSSDHDRNSVSMVAVCRFVHDNNITSMSEFVMCCAEDVPMLNFCRQNRALVMDFIKDTRNEAAHWEGDDRGALKGRIDILHAELSNRNAALDHAYKDIDELKTQVELLKATVKVLESPNIGTPMQEKLL